MPRERRKVEGSPDFPEPLAAGEYPATCLGAEERIASTGSECIVWHFEVLGDPPVRRDRWTVKRRPETYETAQALGLGRRFKLSAAAGRTCLLNLSVDGRFNNIDRARSADTGPL